MPIARPGVLWAHVLTSLAANVISLVLVVGVALAMGFRSGAGALAWLAVAGLLLLFTLALTWIAVIPGLTAKSEDGSSAFAYPLIFLPFISSAFVPTAKMPAPVRAFAGQPACTGSSTRSGTCSPGSRLAAGSGPRSAGASAFWWLRTCWPGSPIGGGSPEAAFWASPGVSGRLRAFPGCAGVPGFAS